MDTSTTLFTTLAREPGATGKTVKIEFNGSPLEVAADASLAAGLLAAGVKRFRNSHVSASPRAPYCMMGVCFECLVEIDGLSSQSCQTYPREGMRVRTIDQAPGAAFYDVDTNAPKGGCHE